MDTLFINSCSSSFLHTNTKGYYYFNPILILAVHAQPIFLSGKEKERKKYIKKYWSGCRRADLHIFKLTVYYPPQKYILWRYLQNKNISRMCACTCVHIIIFFFRKEPTSHEKLVKPCHSWNISVINMSN